MLLQTAESLAATDGDAAYDVYEHGPEGSVLHVSDDPQDPDAAIDVGNTSLSADGTRAFMETAESWVSGDADASMDTYVATLVPPDRAGPTPPPPPPAQPLPAPRNDVAPLLRRLTISPGRLGRGATAEIRFTLSEATRVRIRVERALGGRRVGRACRAPSARNARRPRCTRYRAVGPRITVTGRAGVNVVRYRSGRREAGR